MSEAKASQSFVRLIDGIPTEILAFGNEGKDSLVTGSANLIYVMFPGNPGSVAFYETFLSHIYEKSPDSIACIAVGHANHSNACSQWGKTYNLKQQVHHKLSFCKEILSTNPSSNLVLCGHSVGAYMVLEVMRNLPSERVHAGHLLFPTVEHIGSTVNGRSLSPVFRYAKSLTWVGAGLVACLPKVMKRALVRAFVKNANDEGVNAVLSLLHPQVAYNALYMAMYEMDEIKEFIPERYEDFQEKLTFYFAEKDEWVLPTTPDTIRSLLPKAQVTVCTEGHLHAFVMSPSSTSSIASKAWGWTSQLLRGSDTGEQAEAGGDTS